MSINRRGLLGAAAALPVAATAQSAPPPPAPSAVPMHLGGFAGQPANSAFDAVLAQNDAYDAETRELARQFYAGILPEPTEDDLLDTSSHHGVLPSIDCLRSVSGVNKIRMTNDVMVRQRLQREKDYVRRSIMRRIGLTQPSAWVKLRALV